MQAEPISLADLFGVSERKVPKEAARYDLYGDATVNPEPDEQAERPIRRPPLSYIYWWCDLLDRVVIAIAKWIIDGFFVGLALHGYGEAFSDPSPSQRHTDENQDRQIGPGSPNHRFESRIR
jgi:hypothetical protein